MKFTWTLCSLLLIIVFVDSNPIIKREADNEINPLNEVYVFEADEDQGVDDERADRDKRKIGVVKLGVTNGVINFVFGKLDAFLDAKTRALTVLEDSNKAKNAAFGIDNTQSATGQFISNLISQKIKAGTASIGPVINSASTFINSAGSGLTSAFVSKLAPLSSIVSGLSSSSGSSSDSNSGGGSNNGGSDGGSSGSTGSQLFGTLLSSKLGALTSLSGSSSDSSGGSDSSSNGDGNSSGGSAGASAGINLGAFANLAGKAETTTTTEENIPIFDRQRVSLEIPSPVFGSGFTLVTNISSILNSVILNSARRTQTLLEIFKPFFRGIFAIKGLPSDNPK
ncbi:PREDICTED: P17/29C-like protein DDB_G0287399 [Polistes canadensis]|uniref:P17/29C-like protein DDB_G0287399 n=1 Tax=Polistes canadensis TaxID=91411 RepID=UPI000718B221|nr:PREDICTED: P17/29C-like protein DDB_G0287399 [Polistes canadensis]